MELDIEVCLRDIPGAVVSDLARRFPVEPTKVDTEITHQDVVIRAAPTPQIVTNVDEAIRNFLRSLAVYAEAIKHSQGVLRIGIFYELSETVVFPFRLSVETIKTLGEMSLSIDVTGYPCADERGDEIE